MGILWCPEPAPPPSLRPRLGSPVPGPAHWPVVRMREQARGPDAEAVGVGKSRRSAGTGSPVPGGVTGRDVTARCVEYRVSVPFHSVSGPLARSRTVGQRETRTRQPGDEDEMSRG